jgi:co-chaperonin GroES (HSP10)|tara:strand:- start:37171 stop:37527 length:357 start_codon:yes stop_codon:yes gene_type:complete
MHVTKGKIRPLRNKILVKSIDQGERKSKGGIILPSADLVEQGAGGIRPRWAEVYAVGSEIDYLKPGDFVLMEHGRWTKGVQVEDEGEEFDLRVADPDGILGTSDGRPGDIQDGGLATF